MAGMPGDEPVLIPGGWSSSRAVSLLTGRHGRPAAIALVMVFTCCMLLGEMHWEPLRNLVFDAYQRFLPRRVNDAPVILVDIDEASLAYLGQWPWPRTRLARLIEAVYRFGALAVGLDFLMPEADRLSPGTFVAERTDVSPALREALSSLPANDTLLAETLARLPVVVGRAGIVDERLSPVPASDQTTLLDTPPGLRLLSYAGHIANLPVIEDAASGRGYLNAIVDDDGVVRTMPLVLRIQGHVAPALALELLRVANNQPAYGVQADSHGVRGVRVGERVIPTESDGRVRLYFSDPEPGRRVSALAVLRGTAAAQVLQNRIALIGVTALGLADVVVTPVAARMHGAEVQVQLLENLYSDSRLVRLWCAPWVELCLFVASAMALIVLLPRRPIGRGMLLWFGTSVLIGGASLLAFTQHRLLFDPSMPVIGSTAILMVLLTAGLAASDRRRRELRAALEVERLTRSRIAGELQAARAIQMGMLPAPDAIVGLPETIELHALLEPAREVGGDLYDAFMLDEHHFFFLVGDVAGKGVPASLFMALCQTLCRSTVLRESGSLDTLMTAVNAEISQYNPAAFFVTAVTGIIDTRTGSLELCSAGHEAPVVLRLGEAPSVLTAAGGLPLCVLEDFLYESSLAQLQDGDLLVMMTDGVLEAQNANQELYGLERTLACCAMLQATQARLSAAALCQGLYADVQCFTQGMEASDDVAIMAIRYTAPCQHVGCSP